MPIYDYRCDHCGHAFSAVQSFKDDALATCPNCGKRPRRLITLPAIVFKGSGWYKTDNRSSSWTKETAADAASGTTEGGEKPKSGAPAKTEKPSTPTSNAAS